MQMLWIPGPMPNLNDVIAAAGSFSPGAHSQDRRHRGHRWTRYNNMKQKWSAEIMIYARQRQLRPITETCFAFMIAEPDKRRDPDGFISGALKIIFDALQECRLLRGDGWRHVTDLKPYWTIEREAPGVLIIMSKDVVCPLWEHAFTLYEEFRRDEHGRQR